MNYQLFALLEATKNKADKAADAAADDAQETPATEEAPAKDTTAAEDTQEDTNPDDTQDTEDQDDNTETDDDQKTDDQPAEEESSEDDFSMDDAPADEGGENPDGLPDPDAEGDPELGDDDVEQNIHINILQLSKFDRAMANRKCFADYQNLRTSITSFRNMVDNNETVIPPELREELVAKADRFSSTVMDYLRYKYSFTSYEENLQNYLIFMKYLKDMVDKLENFRDFDAKKDKQLKKSVINEPDKEVKSDEDDQKEEPEDSDDDDTDLDLED